MVKKQYTETFEQDLASYHQNLNHIFHQEERLYETVRSQIKTKQLKLRLSGDFAKEEKLLKHLTLSELNKLYKTH